ncbi:hypothetical protein J3P89_25200 [Pseudomonas sp. Z1-14]|uniref:hypothetical protein n=1 Tax=Pseudomonas sp. Z1-14 TaxID=2817409 RepID=UPI003DA8E58A
MSILLPDAEESRRFFDSVRLAPVALADFSADAPKNAHFTMAADSATQSVSKAGMLLANEDPAIIGFADNLDEDKKQAAADSIHFAERVANSKYSKNIEPIQWHELYGAAMRHCGWTITSNTYQELTTSQKSLTMDAIVLDIIQGVAGRNAPAMLQLLGNVFGRLQSDEKLVNLFDKNSKKGADKDFRIVPCIQSANGTAITAFLAVDCSLSSNQGGAWFWKWKVSRLRMKRVATMVELNMRVHDRNRDRIYQQLDKSSDDFFNGITL